MARRARRSSWAQTLQRSVNSLTRSGMRAGTKAVKQALRPVAKAGQQSVRAGLTATSGRKGPPDSVPGLAFGAAGARRYYLFKPPGTRISDRLPLLVMLHGCGQDAEHFALSTRMNRLAAREGFLVLYPEQDRLANAQGCWNWYGIRSRSAQGEAAILLAAIDQVCLLYPADRERVALAGLSAGASMAALLAVRYPQRFKALAMHSGVPPGAADSAATAVGAMRGRRDAPALSAVAPLPPLLVIQGSVDGLVAAANGESVARLWADAAGARPRPARRLQRGARLPMTVNDYVASGKTIATLCLVEGLGHAWSGGAASQNFSDPRGPDASRLIWSFVARQFKTGG